MIFDLTPDHGGPTEAFGPVTKENAHIAAGWTEGAVSAVGVYIPNMGRTILAPWGTYITRQNYEFGVATQGWIDNPVPDVAIAPATIMLGNTRQATGVRQFGEVDWVAARRMVNEAILEGGAV